MSVQVKISGQTPEEGLHGLEDIRDYLVEHDTEIVLVVAKVRTKWCRKESEKGGGMVPTVRILAWEALLDDAAKKTAEKLYADRRAERTGADMLPDVEYVDDEATGQIHKVERGQPDKWLDPAAREADGDWNESAYLGDAQADEPDDQVDKNGPEIESGQASDPAVEDIIPLPGDEPEPAFVLRYDDKAGYVVGVPGQLPIGVAEADYDIVGAQQWASEIVKDVTNREVIRWNDRGNDWVPTLVDDTPVEHAGADDTWADEIHAMREEIAAEDGKTLCRHCQATIHADGASWLDEAGWPSRDGHGHEPAQVSA